MSPEPTFPSDAFGTPGGATPADTAPAGSDSASTAAGGDASGPEAAAAVASLRSKMWPAAGVAIGIGSAAVAAALLYRSRRS